MKNAPRLITLAANMPLSRSAPALRILLALAISFQVLSSHAALLFYEAFDYPPRRELGEVESSVRWANDKNQFTIVNGSLDYPGFKTSAGNRLNIAPASPSFDSVRTFDGTWRKQIRGTIYVSFLLRIQSLAEISGAEPGTSLLTLGDTSNHTQSLGVNLLLSSNDVRLGVIKYPSSSAHVSSFAFFTNGAGASLVADAATTYLIVAKYTWVEGSSNDVVKVWVNPTRFGGEEDSEHFVATSAGLDGSGAIGRLTLSRGPNVNIDELRIGQTWTDVTPPGEKPRRLLPVVTLLGVGLLVAGFWISRLRRKVAERSAALRAQIQERQKAEQQRLMEQERARIAHDLHDELGADITEIGMLATRAQSDPSGEEGRHCVSQMVEKTRTMVAKLEEIVWALNPQHDSLGATVNYFTFLADRLLGLANIRLIVDVSDNASALALEARVRHQLFLVFKEALANVIRHSGATEVRLVVRVENGTLKVIVTDNGRGFAELPEAAAGHEGIASMRRRMEKLGGQFEIAGGNGRGTTVTFSIRIES
jgi:Signal transduction histidine kinase